MIEIEGEMLVALREVSKLLPLRPNGKRVHISAIYRWVQRGIKGVRLEAIRIGGTTYTSREALQRFALPAVAPHSEVTNQLSKTRQKQIDEAVQRLDNFSALANRAGYWEKSVNQRCQPLNRRDDLPI